MATPRCTSQNWIDCQNVTKNFRLVVSSKNFKHLKRKFMLKKTRKPKKEKKYHSYHQWTYHLVNG